MLMDQQAKELILKHIDTETEQLKDQIARIRPTDEADKESATTWWKRGQVFALERLIQKIKEDEEQD